MTDYTANLAAELQSASDAVRNRLAAELRIDAIDESRRLNSAVRAACRRLNELQKRVTYLLTERLGDIDDIPRVVYDDTPEWVMADTEEDAE